MIENFKILEKNDNYHFNLIARNGEIIGTSEIYESKQGCENGIKSVIKHSQDINNFEIKIATNGEHYFILKAANNETILVSERYETLQGCEKGIASVMNNAKSN